MSKYIKIILLLTLSFNVSAQGSFQTHIFDSKELPDKTASAFTQPMLIALNSGDTEKISTFIKSSYSVEYQESIPLEELVEDFISVRETYGELSFFASRDYSGHPLRKDQLHLVLKGTKSKLWCLVEIFLDYPSPKIYEVTFRPVMPTEDLLGPGPFELSNALNVLDSTLEQLHHMDMFAGVVLIANKDKILFHRAVGKADRQFDIDNSIDTKFNIGYMVDMFNAVALMQLIQAEKLSLKDELRQFLDDTWLTKNMLQKIQIQHLLTHSTGLDHHWTGGHGIALESLRDLKSYRPILKKVSLLFEPGRQN